MSKIGINGEISYKLKDEQFLYFADKSHLGILLIQKNFYERVSIEKPIDQ